MSSSKDDSEKKCQSLYVQIRSVLCMIYLLFSFLMLPLVCYAVFTSLVLYIFFYPSVRGLASLLFAIAYILHWIKTSDTPFKGGNQKTWIKELRIWQWIAEYFPTRLIVSDELRKFHNDTQHSSSPLHMSKSVNYLVGYHPHGPIAMGALMTFATEAVQFSNLFPGIKSYMAALNVHFNVPFYRDYVLFGGVVSANKESLTYLLDSDICGRTGNMVCVAVGGAIEALDSRPGAYVIQMTKRKGFFRLALNTGAHLIPSFAFGETSMYHQVLNRRGSLLRRFQEWLTHKLTISAPLFYSKNMLPHRLPLHIVIDAPIICHKIADPTDEDIDTLREQYKVKLRKMFYKYRPVYDPKAEDIIFV